MSIDAAIGELVRCAGRDANIVVFSPLGMTANSTGAPVLPELLHRFNRHAESWRTKAETALLGQLQRAITPLHQKTKRFWRLAKHLERTSAYRGELCFELPHNEMAGAIRFNVVGREPNGCVEPGEPLDVLCGMLIKELNGLIDAETGEPVVERVIRFETDASSAMPDLLVPWRGGTTGV